MPRAAHGTLTRAKAGCSCHACDVVITRSYRSAPRGTKPPATRKLGTAIITLDPAADLDVLDLASDYGTNTIGNQQVRVLGTCNPETWDDLMRTDANITRAQEAVAEAVRDVPTTKKVQVDPSRFRKGGNGRESAEVLPGAGNVAPIELPVLIAQLQVLTSGLASGETDLSVVMKQYGRMRDEVARRRREFAEAEGVFEALQMVIASKVRFD